MKTMQNFALGVLAATALIGLAACAGTSPKDKRIATGAGPVGSAVLTGSGAAGTRGGAVLGGGVGHEVGKK
jgi:osmotically inducible lipoprotein OsmB